MVEKISRHLLSSLCKREQNGNGIFISQMERQFTEKWSTLEGGSEKFPFDLRIPFAFQPI